jgi:hypothetical protein
VVGFIEIHVIGLKINLPSWFPLLHASLDILTRFGIVINANVFTLGTIGEMQGSTQRFPHEVLLKKKNFIDFTYNQNIRYHMYYAN